MKYPRSQSNIHPQSFYVPYNEKTSAKQWSEFSDGVRGVYHTKSSWFQDLSNLATNVSGRPGLSRSDYESFRPNEAIATRHKEIVQQVNFVYYRCGLIRNIIDLMADFGAQGITIVHPNKKIQNFLQTWANLVHFKERSERFLNLLYRTGNVVIRKRTAKIKDEKVLLRSKAAPDVKLSQQVINKNEIPVKYIFLDSSVIEVVGGPLSNFVMDPVYAIRLPAEIRRFINSPRNEMEQSIVSKLPEDIILAAKDNNLHLLPPDKISTYFYKKDDWQTWAVPMVYSVLSEVIILEKLKLADIAALDGAISNIRIFKLGNIEKGIMPTEAAASKLAEILENNVGGGTMDLVWGEDIQLEESKTTVHQFLGDAKYTPHLNGIYAGMGIPPTLTGTTGASGATNNFISLKTLVKRLEYGRELLKQFWENELKQVQLAMGFRFPAKIEFGSMNLGDEEGEKQLWLSLADRNLISDEVIQRRLGLDPELERVRMNREERERENNQRVPKSSPFHDPQFGIALKKVALQTGVVAPSEVGLRQDEDIEHLKMYKKESGQKSGMDYKAAEQKAKVTQQGPLKTGVPGRPKNATDKTKRKTKTFKPKNKAVVEIWALAAQDAIADVINPAMLSLFNKKNMRQLTDSELQHTEQIKLDILANLEFLDVIDESAISKAIEAGPAEKSFQYNLDLWISEIVSDLNRPLTIAEKRAVQSALYAEYFS